MRPGSDVGVHRQAGIRQLVELWQRGKIWLSSAFIAGFLIGCGGGGSDGGGGGASCSPAPSISSDPPTAATVGQQYRYHPTVRYVCIPFLTACGGIDGVQLPAGAGINPTPAAVFWTPAPSHANATVGVTIATKPDPCGNRASQSWTISVAPDTTAPTIGSISPTGSATPPNTNIQVFFNEEIDPSTVTPASFVVTLTSTGSNVPGTLSYAD